MRLTLTPIRALAGLAGVLLWCGGAVVAQESEVVGGGVTRVQRVELEAGWNAVWLEVEPTETVPGELLAETPISRVAHYFLPLTTAQYLRDPSEAPWNEPGWGVWYAAGQKEAFANSLHAIFGNRAYLVYCEEDYSWEVEGAVRPGRYRWRAGEPNLVGFGVEAQGGASVGSVLAGSGMALETVHRMVGGDWKAVADPATERLRAGEAFWVTCGRGASYQGALEVESDGVNGLDFGVEASRLTVRLRNHGGGEVRVETVSGGLPLRMAQRAEGTAKTVYVPLEDGVVETVDGYGELELVLNREEMAAGSGGERLLKVSNGDGVVRWIPAWGERR